MPERGGRPDVGGARDCRQRARGFGLIEVLATLAIAGIGLLGQALLLQRCLAAESAALRHGQATALLAALAERIRLNATARADYVFAAGTAVPALPACAAAASCTPAETAALDLAEWFAQVAATLPPTPDGAPASVDLAIGADGTSRLVLALRWAEPEMGAPATLSLDVVLP